VKKIYLFSLIVLMSLVSFHGWAYPSPSAKATILELLNGKAQKGQLGGGVPVSFDELNCSRSLKVCSLSLRFMIPQDDFFVIRKGLCNVEPVDTVYDILDDKTGDLTDYFLQSVKNCL
jgi:hypothetical protein